MMKRWSAALLCALASAASAQPARIEPLDTRVENLLRQMTLEEKVGEMTQIDITVVTRGAGTSTKPQQIDSVKLHEIIVNRHAGSMLNVAGVALTPAQWLDLTSTIQRFAARKRLRIPVLYGIDAVHGHQYMLGATLFPQNLGLAATWNPMLVRRTHEITSYETRSSGIGWNFAPVLDVARHPLWSRFFETFGEDVYLTSVMGGVSIAAEQASPIAAVDSMLRGARLDMLGNSTPPKEPADLGDIYLGATGKHFLGYGMPLSGKDRTASWIPERQLREIFLPPFRAAIDAGVRTMMVNSGEINGIPVHASRELLTDLLRGELGFRGVIVSDWEDIIKLQSVHNVARTRRDAVRMAINAGIDISMVPNSMSFADDLISLVHAGEVTESRVDESVRRILKLKFDLGLFERPGADTTRLANANAPAFQDVSRRAAEESMTLLKNDRNMLPLARGTRILVTGPGATSLTAMHGGWTYTWQGNDTTMFPKDVRTLLASMRAQFGADRVTYSAGAMLTTAANVNDAVRAAANADVIVVALAEPPTSEKPGDIDDLSLPEPQLALARAMYATGKPVVLTMFIQRPRTVRPVVDGARAILLAYQPGPFGGDAIARVLAGEVNPSGRLPFTYPRNAGAIEHYDRTLAANAHGPTYQPTGGYVPEWDFGHGLSYTTFAYDTLALAKRTVGMRDTLVLTVAVTNTGRREGSEVVQVYSRQLVASVVPPFRRLRDFEKITLAPGERRTVTFRIPVSRLAFVGRDNRMGVEPGDFELHVGGRMTTFVVE